MKNRGIIRVEGLTAAFGDQVVLQNVSLSVDEGEIVVIVGESGCGKSTLLKHIIGLIRPAAGRVTVDGVDVHRAGDQELFELQKRIGVLFQGSALLGSLTVGENVALPLLEHTDLLRKEVESLVSVKLAMVRLSGFENHLPGEISGGMKKRAGLARAMALNPRIVFFDEPSAGLDPVTSSQLDHLIVRVNRIFGTTMVVITHELRSIYAIGQRVLMLDREEKGIIAQGAPGQLAESPDPRVRRFFHPVDLAAEGAP
ncbi:MAG: ATP-binding cassette domain-containing protein [Proteobacteria bacterium]|nr:ATP-binding cassette domain-containing protein [Pseudomonadota bacterium]